VPSQPDSDGGSPDPRKGSVRIDTHRDGGSTTVALAGELDFNLAESVDLAIREAEETQSGRVIVDLSDLSFIDSTGLSVLLSARKRVGDRLTFIPSNDDSVARLLALTGTTELLG
jgi:anti-anti-sigma factor